MAQHGIIFFYDSYFYLGRFAVFLFFLTSGFVIPWSLNKSTEKPLTRFAISRFFRLYPLYWFSLIAAIFVGGYGVLDQPTTTEVVANITMLQKFIGFESVIGLYWTLQIEVVFYILCALLFSLKLLNHRLTCLAMCASCLIIALAVGWLKAYENITLPVTFPLALFSMFFGAEIRKVIIDQDKTAQRNVKAITLIAVILLPGIIYLNYGEAWISYTTAYVGAHLVFMAMISICRIENSLFSYLGKISYSIYLTHCFVVYNYFHLGGKELYSTIGLPGTLSILFIATIALSHCTYKFIEEPFIRIGKNKAKKTIMLPAL